MTRKGVELKERASVCPLHLIYNCDSSNGHVWGGASKASLLISFHSFIHANCFTNHFYFLGADHDALVKLHSFIFMAACLSHRPKNAYYCVQTFLTFFMAQ